MLQDILCDTRVETSNIESSLVWLRSGPTHKSTSAGGGHHAPRHRRSDRRRNRVGVLRDHHWRTRRWRQVRGIGLTIALGRIVLLWLLLLRLRLLLLLLAGSTSRPLRRQSGGGSGHVFSHGDTVEEKRVVLFLLKTNIQERKDKQSTSGKGKYQEPNRLKALDTRKGGREEEEEWKKEGQATDGLALEIKCRALKEQSLKKFG